MQCSADGLDGYDIVASAGIVGEDSCLIEAIVEASIIKCGAFMADRLVSRLQSGHLRISRKGLHIFLQRNR